MLSKAQKTPRISPSRIRNNEIYLLFCCLDSEKLNSIIKHETVVVSNINNIENPSTARW